MPSPVLSPFIENVFRVVDEAIIPSCVCIMHARETQIHDFRSGLLVQVGNKHFLVTAAHHLEELHRSGVDSFLLQREQGTHPVFINTERWYTTISEQADLAVCLLDEGLVDFLGPSYQFIRITDFAPKQECLEGWYLIVGFPLALMGPDEDGITACSGWRYATRRFRETNLVENYHSDTHLVVKYERDTTDGEQIVLPPAMSGCGIWHLGKEPPELVTLGDLKLCAIQTAWHKGHEYAKGTWTDVLLNIIWTYFPDLQPIMRFHSCKF